MFTARESDQSAPRLDASPWAPVPYSVVRIETENDKLWTFDLCPAGSQSISPMLPGQFNMLYAFGMGEIPISVSSLYVSHPTLTHTIQGVGPVSQAICQLRLGDMVGVRGPYGTHWPLEAAHDKDVLIIAGGVGLCPLRPLIEHISMNREDFGEVSVLYGTRNPESLIYHKDVISWQSNPSINFQVTVDHAQSHWGGNVGVVTQLIDHAKFRPDNTVAYLCGPEVMMRFGVYACLDAWIPEDQIYLSMERNMKCAIGFCGHCQYGPHFLCKDGAVFSYPMVKDYFNIDEL